MEYFNDDKFICEFWDYVESNDLEALRCHVSDYQERYGRINDFSTFQKGFFGDLKDFFASERSKAHSPMFEYIINLFLEAKQMYNVSQIATGRLYGKGYNQSDLIFAFNVIQMRITNLSLIPSCGPQIEDILKYYPNILRVQIANLFENDIYERLSYDKQAVRWISLLNKYCENEYLSLNANRIAFHLIKAFDIDALLYIQTHPSLVMKDVHCNITIDGLTVQDFKNGLEKLSEIYGDEFRRNLTHAGLKYFSNNDSDLTEFMKNIDFNFDPITYSFNEVMTEKINSLVLCMSLGKLLDHENYSLNNIVELECQENFNLNL